LSTLDKLENMTVIRAIKNHTCKLCNKPIKKGEEYAYCGPYDKYHIHCWKEARAKQLMAEMMLFHCPLQYKREDSIKHFCALWDTPCEHTAKWNGPEKGWKESSYSRCKHLQRLENALKNGDWITVRWFWHKADGSPVESTFIRFCEEYTGLGWTEIVTRIGRKLIEKCRQDPKCPYKPLLGKA